MKILSQNRDAIADSNSCLIHIKSLCNGTTAIVAKSYSNISIEIELGYYENKDVAKQVLIDILETECNNCETIYSEYDDPTTKYICKKYYEMPNYNKE